MDSKDELILQALRRDASASKRDIAKRTGIPLTTVFHRIRGMEKDGTIKKYTVDLDFGRIGYSLQAFVFASVKQNPAEVSKVSQQDIAKEIVRKFSSVESVSIVTGELDLIIKARFKSVAALNKFITGELRNMKGIDKTVTSIVLEEISQA
jgi:Lrp/AsnC family leucine-responsive transcriptional regulator